MMAINNSRDKYINDYCTKQNCKYTNRINLHKNRNKMRRLEDLIKKGAFIETSHGPIKVVELTKKIDVITDSDGDPITDSDGGLITGK